MKTALKYLTLSVIIIILGLLSLGLLHPSFTYSNKITIDSSVEEAFTAFTDEKRAGEWITGYIEYDIIEGKPQKPGSKFLLKFDVDGNKMEHTKILTSFKQNDEINFEIATEYFNSSVEVKFSGSYPCTIEATTVISGNNVIYCSMFYLVQSALKDQTQKNYDLLKDMIEQ